VPSGRTHASPIPITVPIVTPSISTAPAGERRWRHIAATRGRASLFATSVFILALPATTVLLPPTKTIPFLLFRFPLVLLRLPLLPVLLPPAVTLLAFDSTLRLEFLLFLAVKRLAFEVVRSRAERTSHFVELSLLGYRNAMGVGWLQCLCIDTRGHAGQEFFTEFRHLLFDNLLIDTAASV
jgi:hypothetical protein